MAKKKIRAYLLPENPNPVGYIPVCVEVPDDRMHLLAFLGQIDALSKWWNWERDEAHTAKVAAKRWEYVLSQVRASIDGQTGCAEMTTLLRMSADCQDIEYSTDNGNTWQVLTNISDCISTGIQSALDAGTIAAPSNYPQWDEPEVNTTNTTVDAMSCGIADFTSNYLIEKFNDQLDLIEAGVQAGLTVAKIAADVVASVLRFTQVVGGAIDVAKDLIEGAIDVTFAVIRASDTVEWRSDVKCDLYCRLKENEGTFGTSRVPVVAGWTDYCASLTSIAISPLFARFLDAIDVAGFRRLAKIAENNAGECDDCECNVVVEYNFSSFQTHGFNLNACSIPVEASADGLRSLYYTGGPSFWNFRASKQAVRATTLKSIELEYSYYVTGIRFNYSHNCGTTTAIPQTLGSHVVKNVVLNRAVNNGDTIGIDHQGQINNRSEAARFYLHRLKLVFDSVSAFND